MEYSIGCTAIIEDRHVGYDVELVQIQLGAKIRFPVKPAKAKELRSQALAFKDTDAVQNALLSMQGCRPGPDETVDYLGRGLSYARFTVKTDAIHVQNDSSPKEFSKIYESLIEAWPNLLIFDLQNGQLHNAKSFLEWWSKPL